MHELLPCWLFSVVADAGCAFLGASDAFPYGLLTNPSLRHSDCAGLGPGSHGDLHRPLAVHDPCPGVHGAHARAHAQPAGESERNISGDILACFEWTGMQGPILKCACCHSLLAACSAWLCTRIMSVAVGLIPGKAMPVPPRTSPHSHTDDRHQHCNCSHTLGEAPAGPHISICRLTRVQIAIMGDVFNKIRSAEYSEVGGPALPACQPPKLSRTLVTGAGCLR